ncbi:EF-hand domain-containing protein [Undibacterium sp. CY21W]|uniref:EF-hand domain-containing protein n=1 Tax=Undibacterium sp. CY21W TaxID=2762293 RepID=UPI00164CD0BD|nr:EF-hand domain-containing protein [Undibacterium sp. CY21W]MBC3929890.1 EF-hand domain-containing protein [Undibacterium sp. CY21W]
MSSISGISSTSAYSGSVSSVKRQRPDPAQMAEQAFSKLDTKGQGYLEVSDLESAFSNIASASGSTSGSDATSTANDLFKKLDADSDGKVTKDEFSSGLKKLADDLESQFNQSRTSGVGQDRGTPPPPSGASEASGGGTDAVSSGSATTSSTATSSASDTSSASKTYEAADTNQDGKVTQKEEEAYLLKLLEAKATASGDKGTQQAGAADNNSEATLFKKAIQLLQAYSSPSPSNSQSISVSV